MKISHSVMLLIAAAAVGAACQNPAQRGCYEKSAVKVRIQTVQSETGISGKTYVARVDAAKSIVLTSPLPATLEQIDVRQGDKVSCGQVVARVKAESAENALDAAAATLWQARDANERLESVRDNGSVSEVKLIEAQTRLAQAQAAYNQALKAVQDCSIRAPYAGTVSEVYLAEGERVVLEKPILRLVDASSLELVIAVPEAEMGEMGIGRKAVLTVPALGNAVTGVRIVRKGVEASPLSHTYDCILLPEGKVEGLLPGMVGKIAFEDAVDPQIVIPASAVRTDADGRYVWTVDESGSVRKTQVTTGGFSGEGVIISGGLAEGDRLVVAGMSKISSGMKVEAL